MARQTRRWHQWIVLDDGRAPARCRLGQEQWRIPEAYGRASLVLKLRRLAASRDKITGDAIAIIEDDDWYSPHYIEALLMRFGNYDLVGEGRAVYYNVASRQFFIHRNFRHASLAQTAFRTSMLGELSRHLVSTDPAVDMRIWLKSNPAYTRRLYFTPRPTLISIKGMYGPHGGLGWGHGQWGGRGDAGLHFLRSVLGAEAEVYAKFYGSSAVGGRWLEELDRDLLPPEPSPQGRETSLRPACLGGNRMRGAIRLHQ